MYLIPSEEVIVTISKEGYIKRTSVRSFNASNGQDFAMKESDYLLYQESHQYAAPLTSFHFKRELHLSTSS